MNVDLAESVQPYIPFKLSETALGEYEQRINNAGRDPYTTQSEIDYPSDEYDPNSGGTINNNDWALERVLAGVLYDDEKAWESGRNRCLWLANILDEFQIAHGQNHLSMLLYAVAEPEREGYVELRDGFFNVYQMICRSRNWLWYTRKGDGFTFRPWFRLIELAVRASCMMLEARRRGLYPEDRYPDLAMSPEALCKQATDAIEWFSNLVWYGPGPVKLGEPEGWSLPIGNYVPESEERRWLLHSQREPAVEMTQTTPFMLYFLPFQMAMWRDLWLGGETCASWKARRRELADWAFATAWDPRSGHTRVAKGWGPPQLVNEGPASILPDDWLEKGYQSPLGMIRYRRASKQQRKDDAMLALEVIQLEPGRVQADLYWLIARKYA